MAEARVNMLVRQGMQAGVHPASCVHKCLWVSTDARGFLQGVGRAHLCHGDMSLMAEHPVSGPKFKPVLLTRVHVPKWTHQVCEYTRGTPHRHRDTAAAHSQAVSKLLCVT
jgi:hypothetical protein